jgi:hypothetical protein
MLVFIPPRKAGPPENQKSWDTAARGNKPIREVMGRERFMVRKVKEPQSRW